MKTFIKYLLFLTLIIIILVFYFLPNCSDDTDNKPTPLPGWEELLPDPTLGVDVYVPPSGEFTLETDNLNFPDPTPDVSTSDVFDIPDDGSWAVIINGRKISASQFNQMMRRFNEYSPQPVNDKLMFYNQFIAMELIYEEAKDSRFFRSSTGRTLRDIFEKQSIVQYYKQQVLGDEIESFQPTAANKEELFEKLGPELRFYGIESAEEISNSQARMYNELILVNELFTEIKRGNYFIRLNDEVDFEGVYEAFCKGELNIGEVRGNTDYWIFRYKKPEEDWSYVYAWELEDNLDIQMQYLIEGDLKRKLQNDSSMMEMYRQNFVEQYQQMILFIADSRSRGIHTSSTGQQVVEMLTKNFVTNFFISHVKFPGTPQNQLRDKMMEYSSRLLESNVVRKSRAFFSD